MATESTREASPFVVEPRPDGSIYLRPEDYVPRYVEAKPLIEQIVKSLPNFIQVESAIRLVVEGSNINKAIANISVPFGKEDDDIYYELGRLVYDQLWGYYMSADPKSTHHGLTHLVYDGNETSLLRRETEKFLKTLPTRTDLAGRLVQNYHMAFDTAPFQRDNYLRDTISKVLTMHFGVRIFTYGYGALRHNIFLPIHGGKNAIERIYYNIEHIIHQNLATYDELHDNYLPVSEELVYRELESLVNRSRKKVNTRRKIIDGLKARAVLVDDPAKVHTLQLADLYYDKINRIDLLDEASTRSRDLFATSLIRSAEMVNESLDVSKLKLEEQVYIPRSTVVGETQSAASASKKAAPPPEEMPIEEEVAPAMAGVEDDQ